LIDTGDFFNKRGFNHLLLDVYIGNLYHKSVQAQKKQAQNLQPHLLYMFVKQKSKIDILESGTFYTYLHCYMTVVLAQVSILQKIQLKIMFFELKWSRIKTVWNLRYFSRTLTSIRVV
jgi:hypothetical protein